MFKFGKENRIEIARLKNRVLELEDQVEKLYNELSFKSKMNLFHLIRIKNNDHLSDDYILNEKLTYLDLSPEKAFQIYNDKDSNFILLDVSGEDFSPIAELPETKKIPLEKLHLETYKLPAKSKKILVISESGVRSIKACRILSELGYFNLCNISGGYSYWPGFNMQKLQNIA